MVILFFAAAPARAQTYGGVFGNCQDPTGANCVNTTSDGGGRGFDEGGGTSGTSGREGGNGNLARTGSDNITPLVQAGIVLIGGGMLLVLVARRRFAVRRAAA